MRELDNNLSREDKFVIEVAINRIRELQRTKEQLLDKVFKMIKLIIDGYEPSLKEAKKYKKTLEEIIDNLMIQREIAIQMYEEKFISLETFTVSTEFVEKQIKENLKNIKDIELYIEKKEKK